MPSSPTVCALKIVYANASSAHLGFIKEGRKKVDPDEYSSPSVALALNTNAQSFKKDER